MSTQMIICGVIVLVALIFLFKPSPRPVQPLPQKQGLGIIELAFLILAIGMLIYWFPWLLAHLPVSHIQWGFTWKG